MERKGRCFVGSESGERARVSDAETGLVGDWGG